MWLGVPYHVIVVVWCGINIGMQYTRPYLVCIVQCGVFILYSSAPTIISDYFNCLCSSIIYMLDLFSFLQAHFLWWPDFVIEFHYINGFLFFALWSARPFILWPANSTFCVFTLIYIFGSLALGLFWFIGNTYLVVVLRLYAIVYGDIKFWYCRVILGIILDIRFKIIYYKKLYKIWLLLTIFLHILNVCAHNYNIFRFISYNLYYECAL